MKAKERIAASLNRLSTAGFTIVELIIVIVVIAILAAITIVVYNGITNRAQEASLTSDVQSLEQKIQSTTAASPTGTYDSSLAWNSNDGPNSALGNFQASNGETLIVSVADDGSSYCIRAYKPGTTYNSLANALTKGQCDMAPIYVSSNNACAIAGADAVYCWGQNRYGQLGNGTINESSPTPIAVSVGVIPGANEIKALAGAISTTCALTWDGRAYCWGYNLSYNFGNGTATSSPTPVVAANAGALVGKTIKAISLGNSSCAIASDNNAYCWGNNTGNSTAPQSSVPVAVDTTGVLAGKTIKAISAGSQAICAIASDNNVYCWGSNPNGQLGNGTTTDSLVPVAVTTTGALAGKTVKAISVGSSTCVVASDNNAYCWGQNYYGSLGNNTSADSSVPVAVTTTGVLAGKTIKAISAGNATCAIASDNNVYCWGNNSNGQLGNGTTTNSPVPVAVTTSGALNNKTTKAVSTHAASTCVLASDGNAYCWGLNNFGQLGNGTTTDSYVPVQVPLPQS